MADKPGVIALLGASRMGKSEAAKERLRRRRGLVLVWSPLEPTDRWGHYLGAPVVRKVGELLAAVKAKKKRVVLWPETSGTVKDWAVRFDLFCNIGRACPGAAVMVEELSRVTTAGHAPQPWKDLCCSGMHDGLLVIGTAQRPAQIDKDFLGNCTEVRSYRLVRRSDAINAAEVIQCDPAELMQLPRFHYRHRDLDSLKTTAGIQKKLS